MEKNAMFSPDWTNVVSEGRNTLVFEDKNQAYGAYELRRNYNRAVIMALLISVTAFVFFVSLPKILEMISNMGAEPVKMVKETELVLADAPPIDPSDPPPPPPPPPPVQQTVQFVPPVVVDEPVEDEQIKTQEDLTETTVAAVTNEGTGGDEIIIPDGGTGTAVEPVKEEVFTIVEQMPEFPGGDVEMIKYIQKNIVYPAIEKDAGISGTAYVTFVVDKEGHINDVKILRGVSGGPNCDKEAMRVVKSMPPWKAGKQNGRSVMVQYNLPIKFVLR